jgi:hypothetical protein
MIYSSDNFQLAATDLSNHLSCYHLTQLQRSVALDEIKKPSWDCLATEALHKWLENLKAELIKSRKNFNGLN